MSSVVDIYDTTTGTWVHRPIAARDELAATTANGKVFFGGGDSDWTTASNVVDIYDTASGCWSTATLSQPRGGLAATMSGDKAFFGGGWNSSALSTVDIFDASAGSMSTSFLSGAGFACSHVRRGIKCSLAAGTVPVVTLATS